MAKIYLSSTFLDLQEYRRHVSSVIRRMGHEDVAMEYYVAENQRPIDRCLSDVAACDLFVGIYAWRYGWVPSENNPEQISITEMEYRQAEKTVKPCLIFLLSDDAPWPKKFIDKDTTTIEKLRTEAGARHSSGPPFKSVDELGRLVAEAIHKRETEHGQVKALPIPKLDAYYSILQKRYERLDLDALTPPQKEEYLQLQLRSIFVEQNVRENPPPVELPKEVWEKLQRDKEIHPEDLPASVTLEDIRRTREAYYEKPLRPILEVLADSSYQHVIILGDPGSGKSTLARYVLLSLIDPTGDEKIRDTFDGYLPLLIELRSYAGLCKDNKCDTFLEFFEYLGKTEGWHLTQTALHDHLKNDGRAIVIFDGLDEIFVPEERERITRQIVGFSSDYPKAYIIVTSRVIGYRRKILTDAGFAHFTLQDLKEKQVATFVARWYSLALSDRPDEAKVRRERIMHSFKKSTSIRQLAGNPMLLTIMAIIGKHQELPHERWKLYDHAVSVLIQHWDVNKHLKDQRVDAAFIGEEEKKDLLRRLAYKMQAGGGGLSGNYIHREHLQVEFENYLKERYSQTPDRAAITARTMIDQFRERNFILSLYGANLYGFVHRAFLEYFCATAFVYKFEKIQEMTLKQLKHEVYGLHWQDQSWHEVLRLICGMIDEKFSGEIIDYLSNEVNRPWPQRFSNRPPWNIALAVQCLCEVRNLSTIAEPAKRLLQVICAFLDHVMKYDEPLYSFLDKQVLSPTESIGSNWPHRTLLADWLRAGKWFEIDSTSFYVEAFGRFVGSVGKGLGVIQQIMLDYITHREMANRLLSLSTLAIGWREDPKTLSLICDHAVNDIYEDVRKVAVRTLAQHFRNTPQILPLLHDCAVNDLHENVRSTALRAIVEYFRAEPQTLTLLQDRAEKDVHPDVRSVAISAMAQHFRTVSQTRVQIQDWAVNSLYEGVRVAAVSALAQYFHDDLQILNLVRECATKDAHERVRAAAVYALAQYFRKDLQTLPLLRNLATKDVYKSVCKAALSGLAQYFHDDPQTSNFIRDCASNDLFEITRSAAVTALAQHFDDDPQTLILVRDRIINDKHERVRAEAISTLAQYFDDDPQTVILVQDRIINDKHKKVRAEAVAALAHYFRDDSQTLNLVRDRIINDKHEEVRAEAVSALAEYFRDNPQTLTLVVDRIINDKHEKVRAEAVSALAQYFRDDSQTLTRVSDLMINDKHEKVRSAAMEVLVLYFRTDPQTLQQVRDRVHKDVDELVRTKAVEALGKYFRNDSQALSLIRHWLNNAAHNDVRAASISTLVQYFRNDQETLSLALDRAINGTHCWVRVAAILAIAQHFREDPQILPLIKAWFKQPVQNDIRLGAVGALVILSRSDPQIFQLVSNCIISDTGEEIRSLAIITLFENLRYNPHTLALLLDLAIHSEHYDVRFYAVFSLAQHFRDNPQTLQILHDRSVNDNDELVRFAAVNSLAEYFSSDSLTFSLLYDRILNDTHEFIRYTAVAALAEHLRENLQTLPLLRELATDLAHYEVHSAAISALDEYFPDASHTAYSDNELVDVRYHVNRIIAVASKFAKILPDVLHIYIQFRDNFSSDQTEYYLVFVFAAMVEKFRSTSYVSKLIQDCASNDSSELVRCAAIVILIKNFSNDPQTLPLLLSWILNAPHDDVRSAALSALIEHFQSDSQTFPLVSDRAVNDISPKPDNRKRQYEYYVREIAINALARYWPTNPDTLRLLRERAENDPTSWLRERAKELVEKLSTVEGNA